MNPNEIETVNSDNANESDINKKLKQIWHILFMSLGSLAGVLLLIDITSGIIGGFGVISFFSLLLIPALFAFPIIIKKSKLLIVPGVLLPVLIIIIGVSFFHPSDRFYIIQIIGVVSTVLAAFGVGAGLLIRRFRESRKPLKIIATVIGIVVLLVPFLFIFETFSGLIRSPLVSLRVRSYVARHYADFNLRVGRTQFNFKDQYFSTEIHDRNNPDIYFNISVYNGEINDDFTRGKFWARTIDHMLTPLLEEEFGDEFHRFTPSIAGVQTGFTSSVAGVQIGQPFELTANVEITARIIMVTESADPEILMEKISRCHAFILQNGFDFAEYMFHFQYANAPPIRGNERVIDISLPPELINDELPALIKHARNNRNQSGVYYDNSIGFRYVSRVDLMSEVE